MVYCAIHLDSDSRGAFFAGDFLKGTIELNANKAKKYRGLYFLVYGAAECHWTETRSKTVGSGENRRTVNENIHFRGEEIYLNQRTYLFGHQGAEAVEVPAGIHRYDFSCPLPPMVPSSFEASHGHIRYKIKAVLDIPWGIDKESEVQFTVVRYDDLNSDASLRIPSKCEEIKRFCCLFCKSEPLIMTVTVPYTGFAPGQVVPVEISYKNRSSTDIESTRIIIRRWIFFNSHTPHHKTKTEMEKQVETLAGGVRGRQDQFYRAEITLPLTMVKSNSQMCRVVQVAYTLEVEASVSGCCSMNVKLSIPIQIGSIPLSFENLQQQMVQPALNPVFTPQTAPMFAPPTAPMFDLPPSFDDAMKVPLQYGQPEKQKEAEPLVGWKMPMAQNPSAPPEQ